MANKKKKTFKEIMSGRLGGYIVISGIFILLLLFYPGNNLITWIKTRSEIRQQEKIMRRYQIEIMEMNKQISDLTTERDTLEKFAREHFHFAEPGEDVYLTE